MKRLKDRDAIFSGAMLLVLLAGCGGSAIVADPDAPHPRRSGSGQVAEEDGDSVSEKGVRDPLLKPVATESPRPDPFAEPARAIECGFSLGTQADPTRPASLGERPWSPADGRPMEALRSGDTVQFDAPLWLSESALLPPERWLEGAAGRGIEESPVFFVLPAEAAGERIVNVFHSFEIEDHEEFALERGQRSPAEFDAAQNLWSIPVVRWLGAKPGRLTPAFTIRALLELYLDSGRIVPLQVVFHVRTPLPRVVWKAHGSPHGAAGSVRMEGAWSGMLENRGDRSVSVWFRTRATGLRTWLVGEHLEPRLKAPTSPEIALKKNSFRETRGWSVGEVGVRGSGTYSSVSQVTGIALGSQSRSIGFRPGEWQRLVLQPGERAELEWRPLVSASVPESCDLPRRASHAFEWRRREVDVVDSAHCSQVGGELVCTEGARLHVHWESGKVAAIEKWELRAQGMSGELRHSFRVTDVDLSPEEVLSEDPAWISHLKESDELRAFESSGKLGPSEGETRSAPDLSRVPEWRC